MDFLKKLENLKNIGSMALDVAKSKDLINKGSQAISKIADRAGITGNANAEQQAAAATSPISAAHSVPVSTPQGGLRYSDTLESMIAMALENGELDDHEMTLLTKRAVTEGVDPDEFEFNLRMRLKKQNKQREEMANRSPVENLSMSLKMMEQYASGGERLVSPGDLSGALALIPGVGQMAAVGGLLAAFIKTPSNLNNLKAEVIRCFPLPDNPEHLGQFISYAASQQDESIQQSENEQFSIQGMVSEIAYGNDLDLYPIWEKKIEEACEKAKMQYPNDLALMHVVKKYQPSLINKLKSGRLNKIPLDGIVPPSDDEELLQVIEFAFNQDRESEYWMDLHSRMYKEGEYRFVNNPQMMSRLTRFRIKRGLFSKGVRFINNTI